MERVCAHRMGIVAPDAADVYGHLVGSRKNTYNVLHSCTISKRLVNVLNRGNWKKKLSSQQLAA